MTDKSQQFDFAYLLDGKGGARELNPEEVGNWTEGDGVLWIDCDQNKKNAREWLGQHSGVDKNVADLLLAGETRPRTIVESNGLVVILRGINMNPGAVPDDMVAIRIWVEKNRIITSHRRKMLSVGDVVDALKERRGPRTPGEYLIALTDFLSGRIGAAIENVEQLVEGVELEIVEGTVGNLRTTLGIVRRQAAAIRRYLAPQRDALERLVRTHAGMLSDKEAYDMREQSDRLTRQLEDLDLAREHALVTQEELMNRVAQEQNARMYLLSVVAAIFLPLTFVSGVLGMNVGGLPGLENPNGFIVSALVMAAFGFGLVTYFKWKKWI
jgi:zinc transporter